MATDDNDGDLEAWLLEQIQFERYLGMMRYTLKTDVDRLFAAQIQRILEIQAHGVAITPYPTTHNP